MVKPGYKQTEIGVIPEDWSCVKLLAKCDLLNGLTYIPENISDYGTLVIRSSNIQNNKLDFTDNVYVDFTVLPEKCIKKDDIIICVRNGSAALIGKSAKADKDYPNITFGAFMAVLRGDNNDYIFQLIQQGNIQKRIIKNSGATINQITNGDFKSILVPFPNDRLEQDHIAEALSDMDELIASLEKLIEKKKAIKRGAMQELLTGKRRLPGFSGEWESVCLSDIGHFIKGSGISRADTNSGKLPAVRYGELYTKHTDYVKKYYSHISCDVAANAVPVTFGAILFAASGETKEEIGKCAAIIEKHTVYAGGDILIFIPDKSTHPVFLGTLLNIPEVCKQKAQRGQGDAIVHIHADSLSEIEVQIPEYDEQAAIADVLLSADREIDLMEMKITKARQVKQGMMQQLLTGAVRLT